MIEGAAAVFDPSPGVGRPLAFDLAGKTPPVRPMSSGRHPDRQNRPPQP